MIVQKLIKPIKKNPKGVKFKTDINILEVVAADFITAIAFSDT